MGDSNNNRHPEMAAETRNTYIIEIMTYRGEILTAILGLSTMASSTEVSLIDGNNDR